MKTSFKIATLIGIPIKIHFSLIIILGLFAWAFSVDTFSVFGFLIGFGGLPISTLAQLLLGALIAVLLFICVLLHELGHSYVTQKLGYKINSITLFIFGGISNSEEIPRNPKEEIKIAIVGPAVSLLIGSILYVFYVLIKPYYGTIPINAIIILLGSLSFYNLILAGFNLIPAFPIDGGRVLRATFALKMNYQRATKIASNIAKGVAIIMAVFGIFFNIWLILIAIFIFFGASQEEKSLQISSALENKKVKDVMRKDFESVSPDITIQKLYDIIQNKRYLSLPVLKDEKVVGVVSIDDIKKVDRDKWDNALVEDVMNNNFSTVSSDEDAFSAFKKLIRKHIDLLIVKDADKSLGVISRDDILKDIQISGLNKI